MKQVIAAGGVAANKGLRASLEKAFDKEGIPFYVPPISLCTDNAAMIAAAGTAMLRKRKTRHNGNEWQAGYGACFMEMNNEERKLSSSDNFRVFLSRINLSCQEGTFVLMHNCG